MPEDHFIGLDVSARSVNLCAVDRDGKVVHEAKLASNPDDIARHVLALPFTVARIGLEAGMLSQHIFGGLAEAGLAVICVETRHMKAALAAQLNKTDRHDARGIAQMMRGWLVQARPRQDGDQPPPASRSRRPSVAAEQVAGCRERNPGIDPRLRLPPRQGHEARLRSVRSRADRRHRSASGLGRIAPSETRTVGAV